MSGGKDRKRSSKTQGWEEAGGEFYQESYPGDLENMQRDASKIATLLPSKQTRVATTRRNRSNNVNNTTTKTATKRRSSQQNHHHHSHQQQHHQQEVHVSMLPDLSENLTDEEKIWEEIQEIKAMPVPMAQKREMKSQLQV
jgi:transmembrane channel-like protein